METDGEHTIVRINAPFVEKEEIGLQKIGEELVVTVGDARRTIILLPAWRSGTRPEPLSKMVRWRSAFTNGHSSPGHKTDLSTIRHQEPTASGSVRAGRKGP